MQYHQFIITLPESHRQPLSVALHKLGALGIAEQGDSLTTYFPETVEPGIIRQELTLVAELLKRLEPPVFLTYHYSPLPGQDWNETWKRSFSALPVGERFVVLPPWEHYASDRIPLIIDPGMAFGTGHHETTRSCLVLMERFSQQVMRERFLDLGTGTGLLAIAARNLRFRKVVAVDTDPLAIEAARKNIELNRKQGIELIEGGIEAAGGTYDMMAANLISGTLIALAGGLAARLEQGGVVIMSGILQGQEGDVAAAAALAHLTKADERVEGKWVTFAFRRQDSR